MRRTSIGLKKVMLRDMGPAGIVNIVRVGVIVTEVMFVLLVPAPNPEAPSQRYAVPSTLLDNRKLSATHSESREEQMYLTYPAQPRICPYLST